MQDEYGAPPRVEPLEGPLNSDLREVSRLGTSRRAFRQERRMPEANGLSPPTVTRKIHERGHQPRGLFPVLDGYDGSRLQHSEERVLNHVPGFIVAGRESPRETEEAVLMRIEETRDQCIPVFCLENQHLGRRGHTS
jgi:hypothetical protein